MKSLLFALSAIFQLLFFTAAGYAETVVSAMRSMGDSERSRYVADLSRASGYCVFLLANPYRAVIDFPQTIFNSEAQGEALARGLIANWRYGLFAPGKSRIVLDLTSPAKIADSFMIEAEGDSPHRFVLDLEAVSPSQATRLIANQYDNGQASCHGLEGQDGIVTAPGISPLNKIKNEDKASRKPLIILDPGHGGIDSGAVSQTGLKEKQVVLAFAHVLEKVILASGKYDVVLTRREDHFLSLGKRVALARSRQGDLLISIHADALEQDNVRGATVYTLSEKASDSLAQKIADKENKSDILAGVDVSASEPIVADILLDLATRETKNFSILFARNLVDSLGSQIRLINNPLRFADFRVLKAPEVPSILLEIGYISNRQDERQMLDEGWQEKFSRYTLRAIDKFFAKRADL